MVSNDLKNLIFNKLVRLYLKKAIPVGSKILKKKYFRNLGDSTIRWYLKKLVEEKYLKTIKKSVGRIPTDKGWKYYLEVNKNNVALSEMEEIFKQYNLEEIIENAAQKFNLYYIFKGENKFIESGLEYTLRNIEFKDKNILLEFVRLLKLIKGEFLDKTFLKDGEIKILIGHEIQFENINNFSLIGIKKKGRMLICLNVKRMDYPVIYRIFEIIKERL